MVLISAGAPGLRLWKLARAQKSPCAVTSHNLQTARRSGEKRITGVALQEPPATGGSEPLWAVPG